MAAVTSLETLVDVARRHSGTLGARVAYTFLPSGEEPGVDLSFAELDARACVIASELLRRGAQGKPVLLLCPAGLDYIAALFGCLYAGAIAVPAYPPTRAGLARAWPRIRTIAEDSGASVVLTTLGTGAFETNAWHGLHAIDSIDLGELQAGAHAGASAADFALGPRPQQPALLQYTSGSTATPKGVLLTHGQLLANLEMLRVSAELSERDVFVTWLPPFHDMGLIGAIFLPMFAGARSVSMPAESFARKPERWLAAATQQRASVLIAPNFAFDVCVRRIEAGERAGFDLSSVRIAYNGAEPIAAATLERFSTAFAPCGFRNDAFYPCYGMAEATLIVSGGAPGRVPVVRAYLAEEAGHAALAPVVALAGREEPKSRRLVGCGGALPGEHIAIVDPSSRAPLPAGRVGEIWVQSSSVASGYWQKPEQTEQTFRAFTLEGDGPYLRTGDLGFFDQGELFVTGRLKDMIVVRGLNHYPQEIERTVQQVDAALVPDAGAAFSVDGPDVEQLVVVQEFDKRGGGDADACLQRIPGAIRAEHDLVPSAVVLIKRGSLHKTSSGKLQRSATKAAYLAGELKVVAAWSARATAMPVARSQPLEVVALEPSSASAESTHTRPVARGRERLIADWLRAHLASRLGCAEDEIDPREPLARYGVDSLVAQELTQALEQWLGARVPSTISYDNPTIAELARALAVLDAYSERPRRATPELAVRAALKQHEPIAIVGMACRFPGAPNLKGFWTLLRHGVDAITEVPPERWDNDALYHPEPGMRGKICSRFGGFVEQIDRFDASFFGISAREAEQMDPQQRMFLEVAWEALEDAGQSPLELAGSHSGVFAGVCSSDYATLYGGDLGLIDADYGTGNSPSVVANRLSYVLDLKGPSETVDTACSSSLVALQHACRSMRNRECELAIVGGVNALLAPESSVYFSQLRALAKDGRCKTFDSRADGFVRAEGAGVVVLKPLARALADGDRIYALVEGGAVNHDGRSNGLVAPNGIAQQDVLRRALEAAGIAPDDLDYVEAHGVGTPIADAVELRALGAVLAGRAGKEPLLVGSAKTNVGHLEAASGMVSVIKLALALHHEEIPPHLHLRDVHPEIDLDALSIAIPTTAQAWRRSATRTRFAGASGFGFGGTNAHVVLREAPPVAAPVTRAEPAQQGARARPRHLLVLSAKTPQALRELSLRYARRMLELRSDDELADLCFSASTGRAHLPHRLALVAGNGEREALRAKLERFGRGETPAPELHSGHAKPGARVALAFAFDESAITPHAALELYETLPQFRTALESCERLLRAQLTRPLRDALYDTDHERRAAWLAQPSHAHAALVSLHYALHGVLSAWGLAPSVIFGAGAGEYAAAACAGALPWEEAIVQCVRRGVVLDGLAAGASQRLTVRQFKDELLSLRFDAPRVPFISASLGRAFAPGEAPDGAHFAQHLYRAPDADDARGAWTAADWDACITLGSVACAGDQTSLGARLSLAALSASGDDWGSILEALGALYVRGVEIDWRAFDAPYPRRKLSLPSYPFQRQRYWLDFPMRDLGDGQPVVIERASSHPLIKSVRIHSAPRSGFVRRDGNDDERGGEGSASSG